MYSCTICVTQITDEQCSTRVSSLIIVFLNASSSCQKKYAAAERGVKPDHYNKSIVQGLLLGAIIHIKLLPADDDLLMQQHMNTEEERMNMINVEKESEY
jgi:hypothetical protein